MEDTYLNNFERKQLIFFFVNVKNREIRRFNKNSDKECRLIEDKVVDD